MARRAQTPPLEYGFFDLSPIVTGLPVAFFVLSLALLFARAATYKGGQFTVRDIGSTVAAYERAVQQRRRQLFLPSALTILGIASFAVVIAAAV